MCHSTKFSHLGNDCEIPQIVATGGATDYSGTGGHARRRAETFMGLVSELSHGVVEVKDHEIGYIVEHMLEDES